MVDKRKNLKRKLRRLHAIRRKEERQASQPATSKTDTLLSSMEALIRKMSMTPSAPIIKNEKTKEEIMNDIAKQRELDMVRGQVQYMYDQMNDDIRARRNKGEVMARMVAQGTNVKPSNYGIDEDDEIYKVQKDAAKSKQQLLKLSQQEIARKERNALHQHLSDNLITKIASLTSEVMQTPKKNAKRAAQEFVDQSFEQVADTAAKLKVKAKIDDFAQQQYDSNRNTILEQYNNLRDTNGKIKLNDALNNDQELKNLIKERDKLQYMISTDNRRDKNVGYPTDPNNAREALENQRMYVEQYVNNLNKNGDIEDDN